MGLRDMFHFMTKQLCHLQTGKMFSHFERSQFVVSRRRLRARPPRFWQQMLELLGPTMPWRPDGNYLEGDDKVEWMDQASSVEPLFAKVRATPPVPAVLAKIKCTACVIADPSCPICDCAQIMERSWGLAFHCWNASVVAQCKCMPDLPAPQCHPSQCQCLDDHTTGRLLNGFYSLSIA